MCAPQEEDELIAKLHQGGDLWVVLENRFGEKQYVESYCLSTIAVRGDFFYGRFRHVHSPNRHAELFNPDLDDLIAANAAVSYGYTNFSRTVSTSSIEDCFCRLYSAYVYRRMHFKVKGRFRKIWDSEGSGDTEAIVQAVEEGAFFKACIYLASGLTLIVPVHTLEAYPQSKEFVAHTEFDGFPAQMLDFGNLLQLGQEMMQVDAKMTHIPGFYYSTPYKTGMQFIYPYFELTERGGREIVSSSQQNNSIPVGDVLMYSLFAA